MRRRIEDLGGAFEVQASGTGTVVSARLPAGSRG
jgi:signal transduction histidine kinase